MGKVTWYEEDKKTLSRMWKAGHVPLGHWIITKPWGRTTNA